MLHLTTPLGGEKARFVLPETSDTTKLRAD